jgi:hypothetical protein
MRNIFQGKIEAYGFTVAIVVAFIASIFFGIMDVGKDTFLLFTVAIAIIYGVIEWRSPKETTDTGAWQRQIDHEYKLDINEKCVTLYRFEQVELTFQFIDPIEIQYVCRRNGFPPNFWRVILENGEYFLPDGGRCASKLEKEFIYSLPGYFDQRTIRVKCPSGFNSAKSMWRKNDPYPKRKRSRTAKVQ